MDRNFLEPFPQSRLHPSPPARVAWIETIPVIAWEARAEVATREGGVDRNNTLDYAEVKAGEVATREGGVDRNKEE